MKTTTTLIQVLTCFVYQLFPTEQTFWMDSSILDMMLTEWVFCKTHMGWIYPFFLMGIIVKDKHPHWWVLSRLFCFFEHATSIYHVCIWTILWMTTFSQEWMKKRNEETKLLFLRQFCLFVLWVEELDDYRLSTTDWFFRFGFYFLFIFHVAKHFSRNPKRLRSVLSLFASLVLTPMSFYEIGCQYGVGNVSMHKDSIQNPIQYYYLCYGIADIVLGNLYYPEYFTLLEGWVHHISTMSFAVYCLWVDKSMLFCFGLILETSSILLFASRIFFDCEWILWCKSHYFFSSFFFFRILLPTWMMYYFYPLTMDYVFMVLYSMGTLLNSYWLRKQYILSKNNSRNK